MQDDPNFDLPSARKTPGGDPPSAPFNPGGSPWSAPLSPDHMPPSAEYDPASGPWGYGGSGTPYGAPAPGYAPPPPPRRGATSPQGRRNRAVGIIAVLLLLTAVFSGALWVFTHEGGATTSTPNTGPVAVATDKPTPTATLKPGQTPLPTKVPTATPQPTAPPGQPTYTPVPTSTPIPYARSASVHFTRTTKPVSVGSTVRAATSGGNVPATQYTPTVTQVPSAGIDADFTAGTSFTVTLTVINHSTTTSITSSGREITSVSGNVTCALQGSVTIPKSSQAQQQCQTPAQHFPADTWDDKTVITNLEYTGSNAAGGTDPYYSVPSDCATASANLAAAHTAAQAALQSALNSSASGTKFYGPTFSFNDASATCNPIAGTVQGSAFSFTVAINGSAVQADFDPNLVISYQKNALNKAAGALTPTGSYGLISPNVCSSPSIGATTSTSATLTCAATGTAGWIWNYTSTSQGNNLNAIANLINGESKGTAISAVNAVPGVVSGSVSISLTGGSYLPQNPGSITFVVS